MAWDIEAEELSKVTVTSNGDNEFVSVKGVSDKAPHYIHIISLMVHYYIRVK